MSNTLLEIKVWENLIKGVWWMPWHKKTMKDVAACDKLWGGGKQPLIQRFPNGETWPVEDRSSPTSLYTSYKATQGKPCA